MKIAVLALQGAFCEHEQMLQKMGIQSCQLRAKEDLNQSFDALIIPGGESTVIGRLLNRLDMMEPIKKRIEAGLPVMGTCAGMIVLAKDIVQDDVSHLATMDISVVRNGYGRQLDSFNMIATFANENVPMVFIRAPYVASVAEGIEVLATVDDKIVAVRQENQLALSFHPELTDDETIHRYFISMIKKQ